MTTNHTNPGIDTTGHEYDLDHRLRHIRRPDEQDVELEYDAAGRLARVVQPRGESGLDYDATYGHLSSITSPDTVTVAYEHDGPLVTREAWSGTMSTPIAAEVRHEYGSRLMPTEQTVEWGAGTHTVEYAYDADGLLSQAGALTVPTSGGRDAGNGLLLATDVGSVRVEHGYSHVGELQSVVAEYEATEVFREVLELDSLGRVVTRTESGLADSTHVLAYEYSAAGRLRQVTRDGLVIGRYGYDANGNRDSTWLPSGALVLAAADAQDRLTYAGTDTFTYTAAGELAMRYSGPDTTRYTYDPLGNLIEVRLPRGGVITYVIDGMNRRVGRKVDGVLDRQWLYQNSLNPVAELDGAGALLARYVYGTRSHVPDYVVKGGTTYRIVTDHLGSVRRVVDVASGTVAMKVEYDAWGQVTSSEGVGFVWLGYAGGITDDSTSLVRFGARDYEPRVGRWTSRDPLGVRAEDTQAYAYASNAPTVLIDPAGRIGARPRILWHVPFTNFGGAHYTNGTYAWGELEHFPRFPGQDGYRQPLNAVDEYFRQHDVDLSNCARVCDPSERARCRREADTDLAFKIGSQPLSPLSGANTLAFLIFQYVHPNRGPGDYVP